MTKTISIVSCSYNTPIRIFKRHLKSLSKQMYPKSKIEHLIFDAGSTNGSIELARSYGCRVFVCPDLKDSSQKRMSLGIKKSKGDIILFLAPDNILVGIDWLTRMVEPFRDPDIVGSFSMYNAYDASMSSLSVYFALIGANDPLLYFLNKSEKALIYQKTYRLGKTVYDSTHFTCVKFRPDTLPTLGDNGHMVRRAHISKVNGNPDEFIHVDAFAKLAHKGYSTYGVVKNSIIHDNTANNDVIGSIRRRVSYKEKYFNMPTVKRIYHVFDRRRVSDYLRVFWFLVSSFTILPNVIFAFNGYIHHPNRAWFFHPVVCFVEAWMYALSEIRMLLYNRTYDK